MTLHKKAVPLPPHHPLAQAVALALILGAGSAQAATITITTTGSSARGGGLLVSNADVTLSNSSVSDNISTGSNAIIGGGGLYVLSGDATLSNSTVTNNQASTGAGGIHLERRWF